MAKSALPKSRSMAGEQAIFTPDELAKIIVAHFMPSGKICEPCKGGGAFLRALPPECEWYEIEEGKDYLASSQKFDWVVTNPPWKDVAPFLEKSMQCADNIVFLTWLTGVLTKARLRTMKQYGFGIVEFLLVPTPPPPWPQSGFQLAATWIRRNWHGGQSFTHLTPLALDGAIAPDNQQVLPADVLVGEGTLPEPPRQ